MTKDIKFLDDKLYYSYSPKLTQFLKLNGQWYVFSDKHVSTGRRFWAFEMTEKLSELLTEYSVYYKSKGKPDITKLK